MVTNPEISAILYQIADILEIQGVAFKPRAYRIAAQAIETYPSDVAEAARAGKLEEIPGVGEGIAIKIQDILDNHGKSPYLEKLKRSNPLNVDELFSVEGLGPKRALILHKKLGVKDLKTLERAAKEGRIARLEGFGERTQARILLGIEFARHAGDRMLLIKATRIAESAIAHLKAATKATQITYAGSLRRRKATIGDIDILAVTDEPKKMMDAFVKLPDAERVILSGPTKTTIQLHSGLHMDLRVVAPDQWGSALLYFTGSKNHNIALRKIAISKQMKLSEYGLFKGPRTVACKTEEEIYSRLGLPYIEPEIREDTGEIQAAQSGKLPTLIELGDLQGDLHVHSDWSDGADGILEMCHAAIGAGLHYIALTDHTGSLKIAGGLSPQQFKRQADFVDQARKQLARSGSRQFRLLHGCEVNIREDGTPDLPESTLAKLDIVVASIHHGLSNTRQKATQRLIKAIENPHIDIIGHPTGRIIGKRAGYEIDIGEIIDACKRNGKALEIDSIPERTDLDASMIRPAITAGVKVSISSDSHATDNFRFLQHGVYNARRGWCQKKDAINALPVERLVQWAQGHY